ncbi:hypothetical protein [Aneurinibacillus aneurinilyticus]|uniref:hypothetical protein n=1 Tax=Aneurinibacillus aneurinilyticus TaxID=1391 RepID=UPI0035268EFA
MKKIKFILSITLVFAFVLTNIAVITPKASATGVILYQHLYAKAKEAADEIPSSLKDGDMSVDLGKFKDKHGNTPLNKSGGTFKNGDWTLEPDNAGHLGYNGEKKVWKLKHPRKNNSKGRVASLDKYGNVISD